MIIVPCVQAYNLLTERAILVFFLSNQGIIPVARSGKEKTCVSFPPEDTERDTSRGVGAHLVCCPRVLLAWGTLVS